MPRGLSLPLGASRSGGAKIESEESQLDKLVILSLEEGEDDNPFQDIGMSQRVIYRMNDEGSLFDIKSEIEEKLKRVFSGRLALGPDGVVLSEIKNEVQTVEGERHISFGYMNLDINEKREFSSPFEDLGDK